jgi:hypothetical protein
MLIEKLPLEGLNNKTFGEFRISYVLSWSKDVWVEFRNICGGFMNRLATFFFFLGVK